ncbi:hypothetical protein GUITHDRAFT_112754 [Guillardia theta CCMP2712]|uniref:Uncharacterized protein n=1 Tax=Guillardia theta (strain CCMP2712) TaxID=905079 RepID=L1IYG3_GUITC|nr:hypothetical protein GUITHDRAFT_112754 [Guillardia theta CCMP2712]EKX41293.1 hypothetical protein GUITHDRAFT_112754 [Guillardia theta CCMP2712]|eukprot:XP_005828273.1 hypothetical protein GUITHDRAFT_112754 [Guillardia theta CCMP2712]
MPLRQVDNSMKFDPEPPQGRPAAHASDPGGEGEEGNGKSSPLQWRRMRVARNGSWRSFFQSSSRGGPQPVMQRSRSEGSFKRREEVVKGKKAVKVEKVVVEEELVRDKGAVKVEEVMKVGKEGEDEARREVQELVSERSIEESKIGRDLSHQSEDSEETLNSECDWSVRIPPGDSNELHENLSELSEPEEDETSMSLTQTSSHWMSQHLRVVAQQQLHAASSAMTPLKVTDGLVTSKNDPEYRSSRRRGEGKEQPGWLTIPSNIEERRVALIQQHKESEESEQLVVLKGKMEPSASTTAGWSLVHHQISMKLDEDDQPWPSPLQPGLENTPTPAKSLKSRRTAKCSVSELPSSEQGMSMLRSISSSLACSKVQLDFDES